MDRKYTIQDGHLPNVLTQCIVGRAVARRGGQHGDRRVPGELGGEGRMGTGGSLENWMGRAAWGQEGSS